MSEPTGISGKPRGMAASIFSNVADRITRPIAKKFDEIYKRRELEVFGPDITEAPKGP